MDQPDLHGQYRLHVRYTTNGGELPANGYPYVVMIGNAYTSGLAAEEEFDFNETAFDIGVSYYSSVGASQTDDPYQFSIHVEWTLTPVTHIPDIAPTSPTWNASGGVNLGYTITGAALPTPTTLDLYWASGTTTNTEIGSPIYSTATQTAQGTYPLQVSRPALGDAPVGAKYIIAVADPKDKIAESDETNNVQVLALPDIAPTPPTWDASGGVNLGYTITGAALPTDTTIDLFWASGTTTNTEIGSPIYSTATQTAQGTYPLQVSRPALGDAPVGAKYIIAVADPKDKIAESDETNNVQVLALPDIAPTPPTWDASGGVNLGYTITGAALPTDTTIDLFWIGGTSPEDPVYSVNVPAGTAVGTYTFHVDAATLGHPPAGATNLMVVADRDDRVVEADEANNIAYLALLPDLAPTSLAWNAEDGGVDFNYAVSGADLPTATTVALYWSADTTFDAGDTRIPGSVTTTATAVGTYGPVHVSRATLGTPPSGATHLLVVADPDNTVTESDEANNVQGLALPDIALTPPSWSVEGGGVDLGYTITGAALPTATTLDLFWIGGASPVEPVYSIDVPAGTAVGTYTFHVDAATLGPPPAGATNLMVVADRDDRVAESDETNNIAYLALLPDLAVTSPTWASDGGVGFSYSISGADLSQATTVGLYWSTDTTFDPSGPNQDTLAYSTTTQTAQSQTPYSVHVDPSQITAAPSGAKYLLAVIDPNDSVAESDDPNDTNNIAAVAYDPITADSVTSPDPQDISFTYDVKEAAPAQEFDVAVYRSSSLSFSFDTAILVGQDFPIPALDMAGQSSVSLGQHTVMLNDPVALHPDPAHEYVFVVADPAHDYGDPDNTIHETHFRKFVLGAVVHGFQPVGGLKMLPPWETQTATMLRQLGYDQVLPYDWRSTSNDARPGVTQSEGLMLASEIKALADSLVQTQGSAQDVVDLDLIGHSRGAVVVSQAFLDLVGTTDPVLAGGFKIMTMLDPHPANNSFAQPDYSASIIGKAFVLAYKRVQTAMQDPQVVIPQNVNEAELFYQHTPVSQFSGLSNFEAYLNLWGEDPSPSLIINESSATIQVHNLTAMVDAVLGPIGHSEVPLHYVLFVLPQEKNKTYGGSGGLL